MRLERYIFFMCNQGLDENIDKYSTDLKMLASICNFGDIRDSLIRDRIVCGTHSSALRERLLRVENLTLDKCMQICRATELSKENRKTLQGQTVEVVHALKRVTRKNRDSEVNCKFCGKTHEKHKNKCPAYGKKCKKCGKENHFAVKCKSRAETYEKCKPVHAAVSEHDSDTYKDIVTM